MRPIDDAEQMLQDELVARVERAGAEFAAAIKALADVAVSTPQQGDRLQWRWRAGNTIKGALRATGRAGDGW